MSITRIGPTRTVLHTCPYSSNAHGLRCYPTLRDQDNSIPKYCENKVGRLNPITLLLNFPFVTSHTLKPTYTSPFSTLLTSSSQAFTPFKPGTTTFLSQYIGWWWKKQWKKWKNEKTNSSIAFIVGIMCSV
jgi:hypothetical protein